MDKQKLAYFRKLLVKQRQQVLEAFDDDRAPAAQQKDGVNDSDESSQLQRDKSTSLDFAQRESALEELSSAISTSTTAVPYLSSRV